MLNQFKISVRKKKVEANFDFEASNSCSYTIFLDCPTISNNSENDDIFFERTTRPRSTPQPLVTTTKSSHRTQTTNTRSKLTSEGKIYLDGNLTTNMTFFYCAVLVGYWTSNSPSLPVHFKKEETLNMYYISFI